MTNLLHSNCPLNKRPTANVTILQLLFVRRYFQRYDEKKVPKHSNRRSRTQSEERASPTSVPILHWTMNIDSGPWLTLAWPTSYGILRTPTLTTASILSRDIVTSNQLIRVIFVQTVNVCNSLLKTSLITIQVSSQSQSRTKIIIINLATKSVIMNRINI